MGPKESPKLQSSIDPAPTESVAKSGQSPMRTPIHTYPIGGSRRKHTLQNRNTPWLGAHFPELLHILIYSCLLRHLTGISSLTCTKKNSCFMFPPTYYSSTLLRLENGMAIHPAAQSKNVRIILNPTSPFLHLLKESEIAQSCPTLCNPMDCSLPSSSIHGIFQARVLE